MKYLNVKIHSTKTKNAHMKSAHKPFLAVVLLTVVVLYGLMAIIAS